jgi:K+-sensing histidine kinase KdpD
MKPQGSRTARRTMDALIVAATRPSRPNDAVIRAAAELADARKADLLVVGMVELYVADWTDVPFAESAVLESYEGFLFGHCAAVLAGSPVRWSVHVSASNLAGTINEMNSDLTILGLVIGSGTSYPRRSRLRRTLVRPLRERIRGVETVVVHRD